MIQWMSPLTPTFTGPGLHSVLALGATLPVLACARRAERMFDRVSDLNRDRLNLLERGLEAVPLRSRLEAVSLQLEYAAPAAASAQKLLLGAMLLQWGVSLEAAVVGLAAGAGSPWAWADAAWLAALAGLCGWLWQQVNHAAHAAEESTAHARRYEFLFVSSMRKRS
jgi:hypothetical protein